MSDRRVELLRRLAKSTTFEGEREAALAKAAELESRATPPPIAPPPRPPVSGAPDWPEWFGFTIQTYTTATNANIPGQVIFTVRFS